MLQSNECILRSDKEIAERNDPIEVIGRNGCLYDASHVYGPLYVVGAFIVEVQAGRVVKTVCRATNANIAKYRR